MSNRPDSFMPLYIGDYIRDTGHLTTGEHGAYLLLIMHYWTTREALPADEVRLARIAKCTKSQWADCRDVLLDFFELRDGRYHHDRIAKELARADRVYEERSKAGRAGNAKRWQKHRKGIAETSPHGSQNDPNHNHTPTEDVPSETSSDRRPKPAARGQTAAPVSAPGWESAHERWAAFREKIGEGHWRNWFSTCRLNGSETSLLTDSEFARDQLRARFTAELREHFGSGVSINFDPEKWNPKGKAA